jgi:hypothetical protein
MDPLFYSTTLYIALLPKIDVPPILTPNLGPQFGTPIWDPNLGPGFGTQIWDPDLGPGFGPPFWTPNMDPLFYSTTLYIAL